MRVALVPVRSGVLPSGSLEAITEAGGRVVLIGSQVSRAIREVEPVSTLVVRAEAGDFAPASWADALAPHLRELTGVVLPGSADGRDLAPRLAAELGWPLISGAVELLEDKAVVSRHGGLVLETVSFDEPFVATVVPGALAPQFIPGQIAVNNLLLEFDLSLALDTESLSVTEADPAGQDLSEARRIIAGGAGLGSAEAFDQLAFVAESLGASVGGTRAVLDRGWIPKERHIGTAGVVVDPELYVALGISGAVQHTAGLGKPDHIISVNCDPHCPMMAMADLAIVTDAPGFLRELMSRLSKPRLVR